jgi:uncharacterized protein
MTKITKSVIEKAGKYSKKLHSKSELTHDWSHVLFVVKHAKYIARKEKMNMGVVELGALLHDIGYNTSDLQEFVYGDHATPSAKKAEKFMKSLKLDKDIIEHVLDTIKNHSGKKIKNAKTREALAVYDADKLDALGPRGFIRVVCWDLQFETPDATLDQLYKRAIETALKRLNKRIKTKTGKKLAKEYVGYTRDFMKGYEKMRK